MGNDQLLPSYNMQVGVFNEYIMLADVYQFASDYSTYRPLMELFNNQYGYYLKSQYAMQVMVDIQISNIVKNTV